MESSSGVVDLVVASVGLLTESGLLSAFLVGVMLQISERALDWSDSSPTLGPETSAHATYLVELAANSGYASLVAIVSAGVLLQPVSPPAGGFGSALLFDSP